MRKHQEPSFAPPPIPSSEQKTNSNQDNRPIRPAIGSGARNFASGRSSYNLDFVDWENEWETHLGDEIPEGGFEIEENEFDDEDVTGLSWVEEYCDFWENMDSTTATTSTTTSTTTPPLLSLPTTTTVDITERWADQRIERLHSAIEQRGGLPPLRALELQQCSVHERQEWLDEGDGAVTCGICLENMKANDAAYAFCHPFHIGCIRPWFMRSHECPLCRGDLLKFI